MSCLSSKPHHSPHYDTFLENIEVRPGRYLRVFHESPQIKESKAEWELVTIFFIHGVGGSFLTWRQQLEYFADKGFRVVCPELYGHGGSGSRGGRTAFTFNELAADMLAAFDRYRKNSCNVIIGHSYGTAFAAYIARERAQFVERAVLISGGAPCPLGGPKVGMWSLPLPLLACISPLLRQSYKRLAFSPLAPRELVRTDPVMTMSVGVLKNVMLGQVWPEGDEWYHSRIRMPVLLIYGECDRLVTLDDEKWMQSTIAESQLETVPDAGHMVMLEHADAVNRAIMRFAAAIEPPPAATNAASRKISTASGRGTSMSGRSSSQASIQSRVSSHRTKSFAG